jgi:hypothetical protein
VEAWRVEGRSCWTLREEIGRGGIRRIASLLATAGNMCKEDFGVTWLVACLLADRPDESRAAAFPVA